MWKEPSCKLQHKYILSCIQYVAICSSGWLSHAKYTCMLHACWKQCSMLPELPKCLSKILQVVWKHLDYSHFWISPTVFFSSFSLQNNILLLKPTPYSYCSGTTELLSMESLRSITHTDYSWNEEYAYVSSACFWNWNKELKETRTNEQNRNGNQNGNGNQSNLNSARPNWAEGAGGMGDHGTSYCTWSRQTGSRGGAETWSWVPQGLNVLLGASASQTGR